MSDWAALQKRAAADAAAQQATLLVQAKQRKEAAEAAARAAAKKAEIERIAAEQRRKEREQRDKDRVAELERRKQALPKTTNLYALKQERIKRGLDPNGKDDHLLQGASKAKNSLSNVTKSTKLTAKTSAVREEKSTALTREEKLARQRNALFRDDGESTGSMALARLHSRPRADSEQPKASTSKFGASSSSSASKAAKGKPAMLVPSKPSGATMKKTASSNSSNGTSARDRLKAGFDASTFVRLNTAKRDTRTIEEIEADMRKRRTGTDSPQVGESSSLAGKGKGKASDQDRSSRNPGISKSASSQSASLSSRPTFDGRTGSAVKSTNGALPQSKRRRSSSESSVSDSGSDSSSDQRRRRRAAKSSKTRDSAKADMRDEIWKLMGRDRNRDMMRDAWSDDEDDDMEATGAEIWKEDARAARLAAKEDAAEQERIRLAAERKKAKKGK